MDCDNIEIPAPYKGLIPYSQTDKLFFFGRDKEQQIVIQNLRSSRLTVVYGASGVGKSSLLRAGVAYHLRQAALENRETNSKPGWGAIVFPPLKSELQDNLSWQDPLTGIKKQLEAEITSLFKIESSSEIKQQFEQKIKTIAKNKQQPSFTDILKAWIDIVRQEDESGRLFILLDQFEEYFDFLNDSAKDTFTDEFSQAVNDSNLNLHLLISIREDALAKLDYFKGRIFRNLLDNRIAIKHLNRQSAQDAIEKPITEYNRQQTILDHLCHSKLTILYGDSSAGKSTILRDGIAYYLLQAAKQNLQTSGQIKLAVTLFNSWHEGKPLDNLLRQIKADIQDIGNIEVPHLNVSFTETLQAWTKLIGTDRNGRIFIIIDQFEEYLIHSPVDETQLFLDELFCALNHPNLNIGLLICIHKNSLHKLDTFKENIVKLCPYYLHISSSFVKKEPIVDNLIKPTIIQNIEDKLVSIEPDLVAAVLDDIALSEAPSEQRFETPYLQLVMLRLWKQEMRGECRSRRLEKQSYINLGKAEQIVQDHLDQKLEDLKTDLKIEQNTSDRLFYYLVTPSGHKLALKADDLLNYVNAEPNQTEKLEIEKVYSWLNKLSEGEARIIRPLAADYYEIFLDVLATAIWKRLQRQRKIKQIEQMAKDALLQFESSELEALLTAMRAGQELQNNIQYGLLPQDCHAPELKTALQHILDNIQEQNQFKCHTQPIWSVSFSPDGKQLVTGSDDGTARLWDLQSNLLQEFKAHQGWVYTVFSPNGQYLATASSDGTARLWDLEGKLMAKFKGHEGWIYSLSFSPNGQHLATASADGTARLWDLEGKLMAKFKGHEGWIYSLSFSPNGQHLATASADGTVCLWNLQDKPLAEFKGHESWVWSVSFSADGQYIATCSADSTVRLWDLQGKPIGNPFQGHTGPVLSVSFSSDTQKLLTGSEDGTARLWDLQGNLLQEFGHKGWVWSVNFSPDEQRLATTSSDDARACLWDLQGNLLQEFNLSHFIWSASFSPDGQQLATGSADGKVHLWDLQGNLLQEFKAHQGWLWSVSFSPEMNPDKQRLATGSANGNVCLWDLQGKLVQEFKGHKDWIYDLCFSPDGQQLATASADGTACLWDLQGKLVQKFKSPERPVYSVSFSPDGQQLATASSDGTVQLWSIENFEALLARGCNWLKDYIEKHSQEREELRVCNK
ncbi:nSTAND1 domain-containing NTPase [Anabaena sp. WFMT]|uniref:nSTAND1 domain-containing NTPase n=1 Tax=Anabaena sp. WFMT TaxID=3449730 RepID=UPI003F22B7BD